MIHARPTELRSLAFGLVLFVRRTGGCFQGEIALRWETVQIQCVCPSIKASRRGRDFTQQSYQPPSRANLLSPLGQWLLWGFLEYDIRTCSIYPRWVLCVCLGSSF